GTKTKLFHFDLYRLEDPEEFHAMGFEEYFDLTTLKGISLVEWPSNCPNILPERRYDVKITKQGENKRLIEISPRGLV
ncbi:MAG: tRNA (adenosine(37)-N6)-threonylcarbamoyltransferase complex ATPase subunit type 1 TsaE, partial [Clostridia bacterium]|nr:tRNA (adenosine(37)-N6)-threonylcarbamoyltransferase complex ATPase subunit type 1 TsaE [Clostridia bacterium]